jgi:hypothetical protein
MSGAVNGEASSWNVTRTPTSIDPVSITPQQASAKPNERMNRGACVLSRK